MRMDETPTDSGAAIARSRGLSTSSARAPTAVVHAAEAPLRRHSEVATVELGHVLGRKGIDAAGSTVTVERRTGGLHATLRPVVELPTPVVQAAAVRVAAALRAIDDKSSAVDVTVAPAPVGVD